jgi:CRISPR/Cas system CMR subunit Cmr4 (Cas7 group RAMP superfamily)
VISWQDAFNAAPSTSSGRTVIEPAEKAVTTVLGTAETWDLKSANEPERGDAKGRFKEREENLKPPLQGAGVEKQVMIREDLSESSVIQAIGRSRVKGRYQTIREEGLFREESVWSPSLFYSSRVNVRKSDSGSPRL